MSDLLALLTCHFIGDFVCQSDRMARGKSTSWWVLAEHVGAYTVVVIIGMTCWQLAVDATVGVGFPAFWAVTFGLHFVTDAVTSRVNARLWPFRRVMGFFVEAGNMSAPEDRNRVLANPWETAGTPHWFFVGIGFDQLLHVYALAWAWWWLM